MTLKAVPTVDESKALVAYDTLKDSMGRFRTKSLFIEQKHDKYPAPYTLKPYNHRGAMSMYLKYMEIGDPTEYTQAVTLLGNWEHWKLLVGTSWFKPIVEKWRAELKTRMESDRWAEAQETAEKSAGSALGLNATKWLAEKYGSSEAPKRGRPSKHEKSAILKDELLDDELQQEDAERLGL